eukprot:scaffold20524_cov85-Skeletonema_dohrnii-CCMP3373.AAC.3
MEPPEELQLGSPLQLLGMAHLRRGLQEAEQEQCLRGSGNHQKGMTMRGLQRNLLKSSTVASYVPQMDAQILPLEEECAAGMEGKDYAGAMDLNKEECAVGMEERHYAATKDVQNKFRMEECAEAMEQSIKNDTARNDV